MLSPQTFPISAQPYGSVPKVVQFKQAAEQLGFEPTTYDRVTADRREWFLPPLAITFANSGGRGPEDAGGGYRVSARRRCRGLRRGLPAAPPSWMQSRRRMANPAGEYSTRRTGRSSPAPCAHRMPWTGLRTERGASIAEHRIWHRDLSLCWLTSDGQPGRYRFWAWGGTYPPVSSALTGPASSPWTGTRRLPRPSLTRLTSSARRWRRRWTGASCRTRLPSISAGW